MRESRALENNLYPTNDFGSRISTEKNTLPKKRIDFDNYLQQASWLRQISVVCRNSKMC